MDKIKEEEMHQHIDAYRTPFGKPHPINKIHKRKSTQEWHKFTIDISQKPAEKICRRIDT